MIAISRYQFIQKLMKLSFVDEIWLFGSRARGDNAERSDIDIAIICPGATNANWHQILQIIDDADTLLKIDCVRFDQLSDDDLLKKNIIKFKKIIYIKKGSEMENLFWKDYFNSLGQAINRLSEVVKNGSDILQDVIQDASIQRFEFVTELFWKTLKKILAYEKIEATTPRDVINKAFQFKLIDDELIWLNILDDRNTTSHVYKQKDAERVFINIQNYLPVFEKTYENLKEKYKL